MKAIIRSTLRPLVRTPRKHTTGANMARLHSWATASNTSQEVRAKEHFFDLFERDGDFRQDTVYSLSLAEFESDMTSDNAFINLVDDRAKKQLSNSFLTFRNAPSKFENSAEVLRSKLPPHLDISSLEYKSALPRPDGDVGESFTAHPLPQSLDDVEENLLDKDSRAIVITDAVKPFRVVAVNGAWESLCGYTRQECAGRELGSLIQGPETDMATVAALVSQMVKGQEATAVLTNYTKCGRKFQNHLRVGTVVDETGKAVRFVGVLKDIGENMEEDENTYWETKKNAESLPFMA